jgi:hypothetical protein
VSSQRTRNTAVATTETETVNAIATTAIVAGVGNLRNNPIDPQAILLHRSMEDMVRLRHNTIIITDSLRPTAFVTRLRRTMIDILMMTGIPMMIVILMMIGTTTPTMTDATRTTTIVGETPRLLLPFANTGGPSQMTATTIITMIRDVVMTTVIPAVAADDAPSRRRHCLCLLRPRMPRVNYRRMDWPMREPPTMTKQQSMPYRCVSLVRVPCATMGARLIVTVAATLVATDVHVHLGGALDHQSVDPDPLPNDLDRAHLMQEKSDVGVDTRDKRLTRVGPNELTGMMESKPMATTDMMLWTTITTVRMTSLPQPPVATASPSAKSAKSIDPVAVEAAVAATEIATVITIRGGEVIVIDEAAAARIRIGVQVTSLAMDIAHEDAAAGAAVVRLAKNAMVNTRRIESVGASRHLAKSIKRIAKETAKETRTRRHTGSRKKRRLLMLLRTHHPSLDHSLLDHNEEAPWQFSLLKSF